MAGLLGARERARKRERKRRIRDPSLFFLLLVAQLFWLEVEHGTIRQMRRMRSYELIIVFLLSSRDWRLRAEHCVRGNWDVEFSPESPVGRWKDVGYVSSSSL